MKLQSYCESDFFVKLECPDILLTITPERFDEILSGLGINPDLPITQAEFSTILEAIQHDKRTP